MDSIKIYSASGALLVDAVLEDASAQDWSIMSENRVTLEFYTDECVILPASCYIEFDGQRFWLLEEYKPTENDSEEWLYQVRFLGAESLLAVTVVLNTTDNLDEPIFNLTAPASQHLDFIVKNLNRRFPGMNWRVGVVPETENIHIEYVGTYASDALQTIVGEKYEWWVDDYVVNVGRCEFGTTIELGYGKGLIGGITYSTANEMRSYAYLYPIGSTRNIDPAKYGHARLQLPNGQTRIDINPEQGLSELVEADAFASIFPKYVGKVTSVRTSTGENSDGTTFLIYHIKDTAIPFNPNDYEIAGEVKHITFQSGELMGADFEVNYDANNKEFEIITQFLDEGLSQLPGGALIPKTGDKYVVWNISMPDEYYPLAEQEFLQAALSFVQDSIKETSVYRASVDFIDLQERGLTLRPGQKVRLLSDEYFPQNGYYDSRITRIIRDICYPDELIIEVSTVVTQGTISRLRTSVSDSATKVASLGQSLKNYVDVMSPQSVRGVKNFVNGLSIGGVDLWRHPDGYVYLDETLVLKGGVVMYGNSSGVDVPSIFDSLPIDGLTIKRDGNGALYVDETALSISGGGGGVADSVYWNNVIGKPSWIGSTKPSYKYSEIEERPDLSVYFLASNFTKANIKNTLGISDWALASIKPTYKYSEISNTPDLSVYALNTDLAKKWTQNDAKLANWDSAYSWGNHANAGYAKASAVTNEFKNYVKLAGDAQSITAQHNFINGLKIGGISLRKVDNYLYLDSSLVLSGGVTMYGDDGTTVKPIWESIPLDDSTLAWVNGELTVIGGTSGSGGISEEFLNVKLQDYQPLLSATNKLPYSLISGTPDLSVYFLKSSFTKANIKTTLGISDWALASAKPTYTASEVGALGVNGTAASSLKMTPEYLTDLNNATPWRFFDMKTGYGSTDGNKPNTAWVSGITGTVAGLGNYRWQIADTTGNARPYFRQESNGTWGNWQRLAFLTDLPTKLSQLTDDVVSGKYLPLSGGTLTDALTVKGSGAPLTVHRTQSLASVVKFVNTDGVLGMLGVDVDKTAIFITASGVIKKLLHSGNYSDLLAGGTINGSITASSFIGNLTGTASGNLMIKAPSDTLPSLVNIGGYGYEKKGWNTTGPAITFGNSNYKAGFQSNYSSGALYFGFAKTSDADLGDWKRVAFTDSNVASATKLATARTIWGQSFDGTGNITGNIAFAAGQKISWHNYPNAYYISSPTTETAARLEYNSVGGHTFLGGNVAIGGTDAEAKLHVHGTAKFTGDTTFSSKVIVGTIPVYQSADGTLFVDANVVFRGGVAMYGDTTTTINEE